MNLSRPPQVCGLQDGRRLNWYEYGDPAGDPCLFFAGAGSSGLAGAALDAAAGGHGIRLLSVDRPGLGHSDPAPNRSLFQWADDVRELADQLALGRFGVLGHSAGGAYTLAVTRALPDRVALAVIGAGSGPFAEDWYRQHAQLGRSAQAYFGLARRAPRLFAVYYKRNTPRSPEAIDRQLATISQGNSPDARYARAHPAETRASLEALADGCRQGPQGPAADIRRLCLPWGFELPQVSRPVEWWHGKQDFDVLVTAGQAVAERLPRATTHLVDGGHNALFEHAGEVMAALREALTAA